MKSPPLSTGVGLVDVLPFLVGLDRTGRLSSVGGNPPVLEVFIEHGRVVDAAWGRMRALSALEMGAVFLPHASFVFSEGVPSPAHTFELGPMDVAARLNEVAREGVALARSIPGPAAVPTKLDGLRQKPVRDPEAARLLEQIDGRRSVAELVEGRQPLVVLRGLARLVEHGAIGFQPSPAARPASEPATPRTVPSPASSEPASPSTVPSPPSSERKSPSTVSSSPAQSAPPAAGLNGQTPRAVEARHARPHMPGRRPISLLIVGVVLLVFAFAIVDSLQTLTPEAPLSGARRPAATVASAPTQPAAAPTQGQVSTAAPSQAQVATAAPTLAPQATTAPAVAQPAAAPPTVAPLATTAPATVAPQAAPAVAQPATAGPQATAALAVAQPATVAPQATTGLAVAQPANVAPQATVAPAVAQPATAGPQATAAVSTAPRTLLDLGFTTAAPGWPNEPTSSAWWDSLGYHLEPRAAGQHVAIVAPGGVALGDVAVTGLFHKSGGPAGGGYGLILRARDGSLNGTSQGGRYYVFEVGDRGEVGAWRREEDRWVELLPWTHSEAVLPGGASNRLDVRATGSQFAFSINDIPVAQLTDDSLPTGAVGVFAGGDGNQVVLERFTVAAP